MCHSAVFFNGYSVPQKHICISGETFIKVCFSSFITISARDKTTKQNRMVVKYELFVMLKLLSDSKRCFIKGGV